MDQTSPPYNRWLWATLFVVVPLLYNPISRWQFEPDKVAVTLAITGLLVGWTAWRGGLPLLAGYRAELWIAAYVLVCWLATVGSVVPHWSLWGDPAYRNGLWLTLAGAAIFMLARRQFITLERRAHAVTAILVASAAICAYGLLQYTGLDVFDMQTRDKYRVASTQAHANILAAYLVMVMPLAVNRLLAAERRRWWGVLLAMQGVVLVMTYSRAGWLAAASGLAILGLARLWLAGRRRAVAILAGSLCAGLIVLLVFSILPPLPESAPHTLQTLTNMFRWTGATARTRFLGWEGSLDAIRERPLLGYGPATFRVVLEWTMPSDLALFYGSSALGGRTHNFPLEIAVETGLIGLATYLGMLAAILLPLLRALWRGVGSEDEQAFRTAALAALGAILINNLLSFHSATTTILFWALAGMAHAEPIPARTATLRRSGWGWGVAAVSITLAMTMMVPDMIAYRGEKLVERGEFEESADLLALAGDLGPTPEVFLSVLGWAYASWGTENRDDTIWAQGAAVYADLVARQPDVVEYRKRQGLYLRRWHIFTGDPVSAQQSIDAFTAAIWLSPDDPDNWLDRGMVRLDAGDAVGALADFEQAHALLPDYPRYYGTMVGYALAQGDHEAAEYYEERRAETQKEWDDWAWRR